MKKCLYKYLILLLAYVLAVSFNKIDETANGEIKSDVFTNLYKVNDSIYRSEQPERKGFYEIKNMGINTVLNIRNYKKDKSNVESLKLIHLSVNAWTISYEDILNSLIIIKNERKPLLIHCKHGSDRTGCIVAAYRMVFENWSKEKAIEEFLDKKYGYHEKWFPNILRLLKQLDVLKLKSDLGVS